MVGNIGKEWLAQCDLDFKIRRSHDRLIFNMGISIPEKDSLYIQTGPRSCEFIGISNGII